MKYVIVALSLVLSSCGGAYITNGMDTYVQSFEAESLARGKTLQVHNLVIEVVDELPHPYEGGAFVGLCTLDGKDNSPYIQIYKTFWDAASNAMKEQLIFHEMGHCLLYKTHIPGEGLMHASLSPEEVYTLDRKVWLDNFFETDANGN